MDKKKNVKPVKNQLSSSVEQFYLTKSNKELQYKPTEKIPIIQVDNFPELGKLTALRFVEWLQANPKGVVSLPTGKTPEHFIKWVSRIINQWDTKFVQNVLAEVGIDVSKKPSLVNVTFVQIDEFYPIDSAQHNSFYYYINKYYFKNLGFDKSKALMMNINEIPTAENLPLETIFPNNIVDLSLRTRWASNRLERLQKTTIELLDEFCTNYEKKIRDLGGIGFFLGGIGPDGHIGFNVQGSDHYSTTRLIQTNYETQAAASSDLGGIEIAKNRLVITIGLDTITYNENATAIIIAAGEAKSNIIRDSVQNSASNKYPATVLQKLENGRFYLTNGAALRLVERRYTDILAEEPLSKATIERGIFNLVVEKKKTLLELTKEDYQSNKIANLILTKTKKTPKELGEIIRQDLLSRFEKGLSPVENQTILHTAPHHDDIMLGYLPYINHLVRTPSNHHHFTYLTSGFTAVTNIYMLELFRNLLENLNNEQFLSRFEKGYFDPSNIEGKNKDVALYSDGIAEHSTTLKIEAVSRRLVRNMIEIYEEDNPVYLKDRVEELINYFETQYPGKKDIQHVQKLKGMQREWEVEILWAYYGFSVDDISHLRLGFYQGDIFTENPEMGRDVVPVVNLLKKIKPTIVTVALDPEGSGPDTHYKVLQAVSEALKIYEKETGNSNIKVWGYRNVWFRFHPAEANIYLPVSLGSFAITENTFMKSFGSQSNASFPSWEYDGPFHRLAQRIQVDQYNIIRTSLGKEYFLNHDYKRVCAAKGMIFLKELTLEEFYKHSIELKKLTENA
ncbi:MAG: PIG-L family deacetylase [Bacteroidetes bacterium]|nr:PIG-L family deacetylase [Bacteroidota bacterium]MBU1115280.1 PIG-L family deacetylase [Bacteroidota bacterium]MBU1800164.1 PIG-L family deacetylase [Bacteroidota bacterium]